MRKDRRIVDGVEFCNFDGNLMASVNVVPMPDEEDCYKGSPHLTIVYHKSEKDDGKDFIRMCVEDDEDVYSSVVYKCGYEKQSITTWNMLVNYLRFMTDKCILRKDALSGALFPFFGVETEWDG